MRRWCCRRARLPLRCSATPSALIHAYGDPSARVMSTHSPGPSARASISGSVTARTSCSGPRSRVELQTPVCGSAPINKPRNRWLDWTTTAPVRRYCCSAPRSEHGQSVSELDRLVDVVGDEDDGLMQFVLQAQHFGLEVVAHHRGRRPTTVLSIQQDRGRRPARDHARPLLLAAGRLRRIAVAEFGVRPTRSRHGVGGLRAPRGRTDRSVPARWRRCRPPADAASDHHSG